MASASNGQNLGQYKPVQSNNEYEYHESYPKPGATVRQDSKFSEQFSTDEREGRTVNKPNMTTYNRLMEWTNSVWGWEIASVVISLASLAVIIWFLIFVDGSRVADWIPAISHNSFLALFMTLAKTTMMVVVGEAVCQLKWMSFEVAPHSLDELDMFDSASRGPWGAIVFLWAVRFGKGKARAIASFGAVIVVLALAMSTITQQILSYEQRFTSHSNLAGLAQAPATFSNPDTAPFLDNESQRDAIIAGLIGFNAPPIYTCASGNCTWDPFMTLGLYSECEPVTTTAGLSCAPGAGSLNTSCTTYIHDIPSANLSLVLHNGSVSVDPEESVYTLVHGTTSASYPDGYTRPALFKFAMAQLQISFDDNGRVVNETQLQVPTWNITSCALRWSAKVYSGVEVKAGVLKEPAPRALELIAAPNTSCTFTPGSCAEYVLSNKSGAPLGLEHTIFHVGISQTPIDVRGLLNVEYNLTRNRATSEVDHSQALTLGAVLLWRKDLATAMTSVTDAYTTLMRTGTDAFAVAGNVLISETYVEVSWEWFALPAGLVLASAALLFVVIIISLRRGHSKETTLWKRSNVPLLFHGLSGWHREEMSRTDGRIAISAQAATMKAQLRRNFEGQLMFIKS